MARFEMDSKEVDRLFQTVKDFPGNAEQSINEVFHNEAPPLVEDAIYLLMPMSGKTWAGKKAPARAAKSLTKETANLAFAVKSKTDYNYLYFPDDGTNTRRHIGDQQFFRRGGEMKQSEIVDRCITRIVSDFEKKT